MEQIRLNQATIEITRGNIINQTDCDAIVNAANAQLQTGGGVAGAIHRIGDPELIEETRKYAPIKPGEAVITSAPNLPNSFVIHCLGPVFGRDKPEDILLSNCYKNALKLADEYRISSVAFPAISTGAFGYPVEEAAEVAFTTINEAAQELKSVTLIRFVLWSQYDFDVHSDVLLKLFRTDS